jgi:hypothetical protein
MLFVAQLDSASRRLCQWEPKMEQFVKTVNVGAHIISSLQKYALSLAQNHTRTQARTDRKNRHHVGGVYGKTVKG